MEVQLTKGALSPKPITLYDGGGTACLVQGYRYPSQDLNIVTHSGKKTAQVFCRLRSHKSVENKSLGIMKNPIN